MKTEYRINHFGEKGQVTKITTFHPDQEDMSDKMQMVERQVRLDPDTFKGYCIPEHAKAEPTTGISDGHFFSIGVECGTSEFFRLVTPTRAIANNLEEGLDPVKRAGTDDRLTFAETVESFRRVCLKMAVFVDVAHAAQSDVGMAMRRVVDNCKTLGMLARALSDYEASDTAGVDHFIANLDQSIADFRQAGRKAES